MDFNMTKLRAVRNKIYELLGHGVGGASSVVLTDRGYVIKVFAEDFTNIPDEIDGVLVEKVSML